MDDARFGGAVRALRLRRGWRQCDLAAAARVSQQLISTVERGHADALSLAVLRRIAGALEMRVPLRAEWRGGELDRLLDADHAALQAQARRMFEAIRWLVEVEVTFSRYGERGSIDLLAFHPATGTLLVVEVKTIVADLQSLLRGLDAKARLAGVIARERGWHGRRVVPCLVLAEGTTNRRRVTSAEPLLTRYSVRAAAARTWLRQPEGGDGLLLYLFAPFTNRSGGRRAGRQRMRLRKSPVSVNSATTEDHRPSNPA